MARTSCLFGFLLLLLASCDDAPNDAGIDADESEDAEVEADGDADADADTDGDGDADGDADVDEERDLTRCGTGEEACSDCHGGLETGGPPPDLEGRTETSHMTVGAHAFHFQGGDDSAPVACTECHRLPARVLDRGHCDSPEPAEVRFGPTASSDGMYPYWDDEEGRCHMVYCHGATLIGGARETPPWNGTESLTCGSCHEEFYHGLQTCECHTTVWLNGEIIGPENHVNGVIDM